MSSWSSSNLDKCGKHLVHITHFSSPHHFWYKYADAKLSDLDELNKLEAKIHEYATKQRHDKNVSWRIGDIVAAYNITWNKWFRGRVENVIEANNGTPRYTLWAIDCGIPVTAIASYMVPLPKELAESSVCAVHEGCIYGIKPAKQTFDLADLETKIKPTNDWSPKAINTCRQIFKTTAFTVFDINDRFIDPQYSFGTLRVHMFNGDIKDVSKCLKDLHLVMEIDNFDSEIVEIKCRNELHRIQCIRREFISGYNDNDDDEGTEESDQDSGTSTDSDSERVQATLAWINGNDTGQTNTDRIDDGLKTLHIGTGGTQHQSRLEKLKSQAPRYPRPLKSQSSIDSSHGEVDAQQFKQPAIIPTKTGRWRLLNTVPMPSGHERETDGFLRCNPKDLL